MSSHRHSRRRSSAVEPVKVLDLHPVTFDTWLAEGEQLAESAAEQQWAVGDWWARGHAYGDRVKAAADLFAGVYTFDTLKNLGSTARSVERSSRNDLLSFAHHVAVAPLPADEQAGLLGKAAANGWTVRELQAQRKKLDRPSSSTSTSSTSSPRATAPGVVVVDQVEPEDVEEVEDPDDKLTDDFLEMLLRRRTASQLRDSTNRDWLDRRMARITKVTGETAIAVNAAVVSAKARAKEQQERLRRGKRNPPIVRSEDRPVPRGRA